MTQSCEPNSDNKNLKLHQHAQQRQQQKSNQRPESSQTTTRSAMMMRKTLCKLRDKRLSIVRRFQRESGLADYVGGGADERHHSSGRGRRGTEASGLASSSPSLAGSGANWNADMEYSERQNSVRTLDLFKYAKGREILAILAGVTFMVYAASWQPISVFILAIMASLMGQYSKQTNWLRGALNGRNSSGQLGGLHAAATNSTTTTTTTTTTRTTTAITVAHSSIDSGQADLINELARAVAAGLGQSMPPPPQLPPLELERHHYLAHSSNPHNDTGAPSPASYEGFSFLNSLYSFVTPIFDLSQSKNDNEHTHQGHTDEDDIQAAMRELLERESRQFLRKSFEINGSAFVLALTQLTAFFLGMTLITWAARRQASRIKLLYFHSCLHQEVTWFEAIDSASGSGSSLNGLVDKFEDGIGTKLALLCYFLGHVALFALTAFYQMFSLAAFCMPFVLAIGLVIGHLSDLQASAIGKHALFAKRSLQLAEEIIAAIRTVFAFNGQQKEITRYSMSLEPVYRKSLVKHLYTALNTSLSKFSIFACFAIYCFYARHLFPPLSERANAQNKSTILAVMRGAEVSIVNILISIPFLEALQQSKGSIARVFVAIERRSRISADSSRGLKLDSTGPSPQSRDSKNKPKVNNNGASRGSDAYATPSQSWAPSISFRMVQFGYADRSGPTTRRRSTLPFLNLTGPGGGGGGGGGGGAGQTQLANGGAVTAASLHRRRSVIEQIADEAVDSTTAADHATAATDGCAPKPASRRPSDAGRAARRGSVAVNQGGRRQSAVIRHMLGNEIRERKLGTTGRVLTDFNLEIEAGQSVALVGPSGSGKSTLLALVQRLYDISGGQLLVGRHDIKDLNLAWLRNQIGLVGQEPRLFDMSIAENIALGLSQEQFDELVTSDQHQLEVDSPLEATGEAADRRQRREQLMQQVVEAAQAANAHEFISRLPRGYATRVGSGGFQLSGGQKQRIAIARALIRKPKILLLDECTSALDTESEALVHAALKSAPPHSTTTTTTKTTTTTESCSAAPGQRTTLIVAHRLETIRHVDLIVVMNQGQVVACGTHGELMRAACAPTSDIHQGAKIYKHLYEEQLQARQQQQRATSGCGNGDAGGGNSAGVGGNAILEEREENEEREEDCDNGRADESARGGVGKRGLSGAAAAPALAATTKGLDKGEPSLSRTAGFFDENLQEGALAGKKQHADEDNAAKQDNNKDHDDDDDDDDDDEYDEYEDSSSSDCSGSSIVEKPGAWRLWQFIEMPPWSALAATLVCLLSGLILPMHLIAHSYLFSAFAYEELDQIGDYLYVFGLLMLSFSTFVLIVSFLQVILPGYVGEKLSARLRVKTLDSLLQKPMFFFDMDANSAGALCDRFNGYISNLQSIAGTRVATMLEACSTLAAGALFGFGQNFALSCFCLSFALLVLVTTIVESRIVERESSLQQRHDGQLAHLMADALSNIKTIASLNRERYFIAKFRAILKQRERGIGRPLVCLHTFLTSLKFVMPAMSWSASMFYGSYLLTADRIDLQTIYIVCPVVLFAVNDTFRALVFLPELLKARKSIERLFKLNRDFSPEVLQTLTFGQQLAEQSRLHLEQLAAETQMGAPFGGAEVQAAAGAPALQPMPMAKKKSISFALDPNAAADQDEAADGGPAGAHRLSVQLNRRLSNVQNLPSYMRRKSSRLNSLIPRANARGRIEFKHVEFAYPNRPTALALDDFTLSIAPGESVALVGASGSGKSTTVAILEKFYDYHAGDVTLDGRDLRLVEPNWVRSQIGLVQQEPCLLSYTIGDNIRYGDNGRFVTMDEVVEAARTANIHDFIMTLPDQYDTELSSSAYSSCQLSGGQRQRIAIARALVRNAPILVFDEATSALDNRSEQVVQDALRKAKRGRTNLTIAHRLATIKDADKIVVMRDGRVAEQGRHEELLARPNGLYKSLWAKQGGGQ